MKGMKGKLMKKLKSTVKPTLTYLKQQQDRLVLQVINNNNNCSDGNEPGPVGCGVAENGFFSESRNNSPIILKSQTTQLIWQEMEEEKEAEPKHRENDENHIVKERCHNRGGGFGVVDQEIDVVDVSELMRDLDDVEENMEDDDDGGGDSDKGGCDDKENVRPSSLKGNGEGLVGFEGDVEVKMEVGSLRNDCSSKPLSEIDISPFRRPLLNSCSLFDPNLLVAFEQAVKEHMRMSELERQARIEEETLDRRKQETEEGQPRILQENLECSEEVRINEERNLENNIEENEVKEEPPLKARRIEEELEDDDPLSRFEERCPPGGTDSVILYTTSLRGIRKTFEGCNSIRFLLESFRISFLERDVSMHMEFKEELWRVLGGKVMPPRLFIKGRHIGGAEEVQGLHEQGKLRVLFEGIPIDRSVGPCEACAGFRFVLCFKCSGSHRVIGDDGFFITCENCNENGLIICPYCC